MREEKRGKEENDLLFNGETYNIDIYLYKLKKDYYYLSKNELPISLVLFHPLLVSNSIQMDPPSVTCPVRNWKRGETTLTKGGANGYSIKTDDIRKKERREEMR